MSETEGLSTPIIESITLNTTVEEFESMAKKLVTPKDRKLFGKEAEDLVTKGLLYMAVMAPAPATFDSEAFGAIVDDAIAERGEPVDPDRIDILLSLARNQGIVDANETGRLFITPENQQKISHILDQYEGREEAKK